MSIGFRKEKEDELHHQHVPLRKSFRSFLNLFCRLVEMVKIDRSYSDGPDQERKRQSSPVHTMFLFIQVEWKEREHVVRPNTRFDEQDSIGFVHVKRVHSSSFSTFSPLFAGRDVPKRDEKKHQKHGSAG